MELHQLRYFLAVARTQSFVRAAEEEDVAQPTLSQQIKKLETDLGAPLFDRLGRSVALTRYGQALLPHAEAALRETRQARKAIDALNNPAAGTLTVGAIPTILPYALVEPLAAFRERFPDVNLEIRETTKERLVHQLRFGEIDIAILALPVKHPELVCSELFREPLLVALPEGHELSAHPPVDLARLTSERMLLLREGHCLRNDVLTTCTRAKADFASVFESDQLSSILAMVANGFGVSLIPAMAAGTAAGCILQPVRPAGHRRIGYVQAAGHHPTPLQKRFILWLKQWRWLER